MCRREMIWTRMNDWLRISEDFSSAKSVAIAALIV
jgi:hypothetical protein